LNGAHARAHTYTLFSEGKADQKHISLPPQNYNSDYWQQQHAHLTITHERA